MPYDPTIHHRRSIRLRGYDYTLPGAYFVTICTYHAEPLLGTLTDGRVVLSDIGRAVERCWLALPQHFAGVALDVFALMPDHLHGIVVIEGGGRSLAAAAAPQQKTGSPAGSLPAIVQNFKSVSVRRVHALGYCQDAPLWQRNYYERVIRDEPELEHIREYIQTNPLRRGAMQYG